MTKLEAWLENLKKRKSMNAEYAWEHTAVDEFERTISIIENLKAALEYTDNTMEFIQDGSSLSKWMKIVDASLAIDPEKL